MKIDWNALLMVAGVSIVSTVVFVVLLAIGIRMVMVSRVQVKQGGTGSAALGGGYLAIALAALLVLFGIYLIVPQFH